MTAREAWAEVRALAEWCPHPKWKHRKFRGVVLTSYAGSCGRCDGCRAVRVLDAHFGAKP